VAISGGIWVAFGDIHEFCVTGRFLVVARGEGFEGQVGKQTLHLAVSQLATLNAGGRTDAFDGHHAPQDARAQVLLKLPRKPEPAGSREFLPTEFLREENQIQ
jgi:hypothetical protein